MIHDAQSAQTSQKQDEQNIYAIMKIMCPPGYHHNGFVLTHALGHMMYGYTLLVPMNQRVLNKPRTLCVLDHLWPLILCSLLGFYFKNQFIWHYVLVITGWLKQQSRNIWKLQDIFNKSNKVRNLLNKLHHT